MYLNTTFLILEQTLQIKQHSNKYSNMNKDINIFILVGNFLVLIDNYKVIYYIYLTHHLF